MMYRALFVLVSLVSFCFSQPAISADTQRSAELVQDADFFGFDLRTEKNLSLDQCKTSCIADQSCKAFTYSTKRSWCFLKSDFKTMKPLVGAIAGKIIEPGRTAETELGAAPKLSFLPDDVERQAREQKAKLAVAADEQNKSADALYAQARYEALSDVVASLKTYKSLLALQPDNPDLWSEAANVATTARTNNVYGEGVLFAVNAYNLTRTAQARAGALDILAKALALQENYRSAINAYKESLALVSSKETQAAYLKLKADHGFRITDHSVDNDAVVPRVCATFSDPIVKTVDYTPFVTVNGSAPKSVAAKDRQICVEGLTHGEHYQIVFRAELPSSVGENLEAPVNLDIYVKDRTPSVHFSGDGFVLPSTVRRGIPLVSVNMTSAKLALYRIGERGIAPLLTSSNFLTQLSSYGASRIEEESGELVWNGSIDIGGELNKDTVTSFPIDEALPQRKPGIYVLTASSPEKKSDEWDDQATQWFLVSDIGITTYAGSDGLNVFTRSLQSAKAMEGVELQLLAKNNEVLGTAKTDASGRATFAAGLIRGTAALTPAVIAAKNAGGDYVFLDMTRAGFDLSDRGVTGRSSPGAIDLLSWTERGIYRAGETVHAAALARDLEGKAVEKLPLTFVFKRPDGVEDRRMILTQSSLGGYVVDLPTPESAMRGSWSMMIYADPKGSPLSVNTFLIDDFVPDRTDMTLTTDAKEIGVDSPATIKIQGKYLYGAPAAGLTLDGDVVLRTTRTLAAFPNYSFGLADEEASGDGRQPIEGLPTLDESGEASTDLNVGTPPSSTRPLEATVYIRMQEVGGRAIERSLTLPVKSGHPFIGIKPEFSGDLPENSLANFTVIGVGTDGAKANLKGLRWKLLSLERNYQWYREGTSWRYESVYTTKQVANGTVDTGADGARISAPVGWGRYRLEVESAEAEGPASSVEFDAGWFVAATSTETPDGLEIALDKASYKVGETAHLKVASRYAGQLMVTIGHEKLIDVKNAEIAANGGEMDLPVTADWGAGTYVTATLFRPGDAQDNHMPMRSIGIKWLKVDPEQRALEINVNAPDKTQPRGPLDIDISVSGANVNEEAYVTLAAVDVGILNLTRYEPPNPEEWYFGQKMLGLEIRDIYGRLIDGSLGSTGRLRTGGDGGEVSLQASPPKEKLLAFFSGPVKLDATGHAKVTFDLPQFNGTARLMAVAWTKTGVGHATRDVIIRDPIVVTASLPKFLAPGDQAELRIEAANTDGPAGTYQLQVLGNQAVGVRARSQALKLDAGGRATVVFPVTGLTPGDGAVAIRLSGNDLTLDQTLNVPVRSPAMPLTNRRLVSLAPGKSLTIDKALLADSILPGASISVNVTRSAAFDIPALVMSLDRYPFGCAEQTTSKALPLLYVSDLIEQYGMDKQEDIKKRVQDAIYRVLSYQSSSGSFGLWGPSSGDLWLDSYVTDFLTRAREKNFAVPEEALAQALRNLENSLSYDVNIEDQGEDIAYALYVLARNRKASISDLRYYADTKIDSFPTPLSKAHIAAALSLYGDAVRSKTIFASALQMSSTSMITPVNFSRDDYGTPIRDAAAILALAAESRPVPPIIPQLEKALAASWAKERYFSTQEEAWMLIAARSLQGSDADLSLEVNGAAHQGGYRATVDGDALLNKAITVTNRGMDNIAAVVTSVAAPAVPLPASENGFAIERHYYTLDGQETEISQARQNERYVVVLRVTKKNQWEQRIVVTDLLPAGLEIDNPSLVDSAKLANFDWLGAVKPAHTEFRSDRFVAAFGGATTSTSDDSSDDDSSVSDDSDTLTVAYVVRAVTPGVYDHPAATVEDMYRPQFSARTAMSKMEVLSAKP
ncbi:alpha-2-macroglobulin family protein [Oryzifoliimicrobium ureilyticus]|uniref:alpha-2-macroglobulin family protein n=1 Tax=Oryzifoliimicrobium ureilyticus TaxID=3113724 RepID=UPI003076396B